MTDERRYLLPSQANKAPDTPGLYKFMIRIPGDYELGLVDTEVNTEKALLMLKEQLDRLAHGLFDTEMSGFIDDRKAHHIRTIHSIRTTSGFGCYPSAIVDEIIGSEPTREDVKSLTRHLRSLLKSLPPLYVGITTERTLKERLREHLDGATSIGNELERRELTWSALEFHCISIDVYSRESTRALEKLVQLFFRPSLSKS